MSQSTVRQSASGATASMVVTFDEMPRTILGTSDRNPWETQPAARLTPNLEIEPVLWRDILEPWRKYLVSRKRAESTVRGYGRFVVGMFERIGKADLREITWTDLSTYGSFEAEKKDGWSPSTYNSWVYAVKSFYGFAVDKLDAPIRDMGRKLDPLDADTVQRSQEPNPPLTREEFQAVLKAAEARGDIEWSLAARYAWTTISRMEDVWSVTWGQLDLGPKPKVLYPRPSKHGSNLVKLLDTGLARRLKDWRGAHDSMDGDPVFRRLSNRETDKPFCQWFDRNFKRYAADKGLDKYVHPHLVRASADSHAAAREVAPEFRERQGGWTAPGSRPRYERQDPETFRKWVEYLALD